MSDQPPIYCHFKIAQSFPQLKKKKTVAAICSARSLLDVSKGQSAHHPPCSPLLLIISVPPFLASLTERTQWPWTYLLMCFPSVRLFRSSTCSTTFLSSYCDPGQLHSLEEIRVGFPGSAMSQLPVSNGGLLMSHSLISSLEKWRTGSKQLCLAQAECKPGVWPA